MKDHLLPGILLLLLLLTVSYCSEDESATKDPFVDLGAIPHAVTIVAPFQSATFHNGEVYVGTDDGVWKINPASREWTRAGLAGKAVTMLYEHSTADLLFAGVQTDFSPVTKTLFKTTDGMNWEAVAQPIFNDLDQHYEAFACMADRPGHPEQLYANLGGATVAVSTDYGQHWSRANYATDSFFGYESAIAFLPTNSDLLFQGSENPLDDAWLGKYSIDDNDPVKLEDFEKIVTMDTWGNRRPDEMRAFSYAPGVLYIGQEGALSKVEGATSRFIYRSDENSDQHPYSYIYGIWVDPENVRHIIFGGALNNDIQPMSLFETFDEGTTVDRIENKLGLANPEVCEILPGVDGPFVILRDRSAKTVKVAVYNGRQD